MVVWCLLIAVLLLPIGGLSVDLWRAIAAQRDLQAAAEDAALAGASGIDVQAYRTSGCLYLDPSVAEQLAASNLAQQPVAAQLSSSEFSVSSDGRAVQVTLSEDVHLSLLRLVEGDRPLVIAATAASGPVGSLSGGGC